MSFDKIGKQIQKIAGWGTCVTCGKEVHKYGVCSECHKAVHEYGCSKPSYETKNGRRIQINLCNGCVDKPGGTCVKCKKDIPKLWGSDGKNVCSHCGKPMHRGCGSYGVSSDDKICWDCQVKLANSVR